MSRANQSVKKSGTDQQSVPYLGVQRRRTASSGASERNRDELCLIVGLHPHEHGMLAILLGLADGFAHILWGSDFGAANFKDDVAALESMLGRNSVGIDLCDHHAFRPASCNLSGRGNCHAKLRQPGTCDIGVRTGGAGLSRFRQFAQRQESR